MGDNDGNISIWRIADNMGDKCLKAVKLFKSHPDTCELIEDLVWDQDVNYINKGLISHRKQQ